MQKITAVTLKYLREALRTEAEKRHSLVGRANLWKMKRQFQIEFLKKVGLKPQHYLLDIGCGTFRGGIPIIEYLQDGHYYGLESRLNVLEEGKKELKKYNLEYKIPKLIYVENLYKVNCGIWFDFIWAFSVVFHMDDDILEDNLDCVQRHLMPAGVFYANVNIGEQEDETWQGFPVVWRTLDFYQMAGHRHGLQMSDMGTLESLGHFSGIASQDLQRMLRFSKVE